MLASFKHVTTINPESKRYMKVLEREQEGLERSISLNFRNLEMQKGVPPYRDAGNHLQGKLIFGWPLQV